MRRAIPAAALAVLSACATSRPPLATVDRLDLERYMGDWYVIAHVPASIERNAYNAVESYRLEPDGTIATTFTFREGAFDGPERRYTPRGFVRDRTTNATWGMQFVWPVKAEFLVVHHDEARGTTIVARSKRDYAWIMARTPEIPEPEYGALVRRLADAGYDLAKLRRVPQRWPAAPAAPAG
jgi:apolipoprotein D and lipocalin family protein